ncbi:MAG: YihA family ribosome biogenesis GTP-binding protein [Clostridia bacterium]|jgi:GTP-binding protein|nr:YihA family ribosome biogenesis GTP-binding protein [Clostridia bacterium]MBQ5612168.1 YihA family ribosome biogenesis GTP-binding protein [Clostridia bacterium]MBQ5661529.1 YihA family ribosome biogenesis GTP-binding protein [Clostridia bacterium]MBQ5772060.1 YihA family ribosome biogenesis GTP-binding protein [Clostridia bacterium]MBQ5892873.1 YihA family ribosome biogenesis GTP-binding protein [Clostridia bacterium]
MSLNLNRTELRISAGQIRQFPADPMVQIAFSGRSNVGKSSLINSLLGRKSLARVSASPGKTITINFYDVDKQLFLVDLPGYGFAKRNPADKAQWSALTDGYFTKNPNLDRLRLVIQLVDSRIGPTADDEMMLSFLRESGLPFIVVATKADKLNATERKKSTELLHNHPDIPADTPILFYSSQKGEGRADLWRLIAQYTDVKL